MTPAPHLPVTVGYDIFTGSAPATHQSNEDTLTTTDAAGRFVDRIAVSLGGAIAGVQAQATDLASNAVVTASL